MGPPRKESSCCSRGAVIMLVSFWSCCNRVSSFSPSPSTFLGGAQRVTWCRTGTTPSRAAASAAALTSTSTTAATWLMAAGSQGGRKRRKLRRAFRRSSLHAANARGKWGSKVWDKLRAPPPDGRAHDEVTFRSGYEGEALTIPQGGLVGHKYCLSSGWMLMCDENDAVMVSVSCFFVFSGCLLCSVVR